MNGLQIEFLVGLFIAANAIDGSFRVISIHWVKFLVGILLVLLAIFGVDLLTIR